MLIVSWNVAGLSTTVQRIHDYYGSSSTSTKTTVSLSSPLASFFTRHAADIFCIQEHKIPLQQLKNRCEPFQAATLDGWESFWSCCICPQSKGMNGVVTYAKQGTVIRANAKALCDPQLDNQGRCIVTDHGSFIVFNVYVPASGGQPLSQKMRFLRALQGAMHRERVVHKKPVILVGDLNISYNQDDVFWKDRILHVDEVLQEPITAQVEQPVWKEQLIQSWPWIVQRLQTAKVVPTKTKNSLTKEEYQKFRLAVTVPCATSKHNNQLSTTTTTTTTNNTNNNSTSQKPPPERLVYLGKHETSPEYCQYAYDFLEPSTYIDPETDQEVIFQKANSVRLHIVQELLCKLCNITFDDKLLREIAKSQYVSIHCDSPPRKWLRSLLEEDGMVDVFRYWYPTAQGRFTCWNQSTNRRYVNDGARIDYTIVDSELLSFVQKGNVTSLRCGRSSQKDSSTTTQTERKPPSSTGKGTMPDTTTDENHDHDQTMYSLSEEAALAATTANGLFQPVSFEGGGISEAPMEALNSQFGPQHSGMIYTPPSFSDHIAVSLLLDDSILPKRDLVLNQTDAATKHAQPHKSQPSITSFFGKSNGTTTAKTQTNGTKKGVNRFQVQRQSFQGSVAKTSKSSYSMKGSSVLGVTKLDRKRSSASTSSQPKRPKAPSEKGSILQHFSRSK